MGPPLGPGLFAFQSGYQFPQFGFNPLAPNPYLPPVNPTNPTFSGFGTPNYHYMQPAYHPYANIPPTDGPSTNLRPVVPPRPIPPMFDPHNNAQNSRRLRSPTPPFDMTNTDDPSQFPDLGDWLETVDQDFFRGRRGHGFSQLSARFELDGLSSLLDLEGISIDTLVSQTGINEDAAETLLQYAHEDINNLRAHRPSSRTKRGRYSY
jgi:hypothetical protein